MKECSFISEEETRELALWLEINLENSTSTFRAGRWGYFRGKQRAKFALTYFSALADCVGQFSLEKCLLSVD